MSTLLLLSFSACVLIFRALFSPTLLRRLINGGEKAIALLVVGSLCAAESSYFATQRHLAQYIVASTGRRVGRKERGGGGFAPLTFEHGLCIAKQAAAHMHIAIIMDGNGRWATKRGLPRSAGHVAGAKAVGTTVAAAARAGVKTLTLYAFSAANWARPATEVDSLMRLFRRYLVSETRRCVEQRIRINVVGRRDHRRTTASYEPHGARIAAHS